MDQSGNSGGGEKGSVSDILKPSIFRICWPDLINSMGERGCGFCCSVAQPCLILPFHGLQHISLPCPSPSPRAYSNSCPLTQWRHPNISSSVISFSSCLQPFPASWFFSNESALCIRWPTYWNFSFSISPSNEYSWLISFRMDWFDLLAVQGTLKSFLQHHCAKTSVLWCSAFFVV